MSRQPDVRYDREMSRVKLPSPRVRAELALPCCISVDGWSPAENTSVAVALARRVRFPTHKLWLGYVSDFAPTVARNAGARKAVTVAVRAFLPASWPATLEGRDASTWIVPKATLKPYLDCYAAVRYERSFVPSVTIKGDHGDAPGSNSRWCCPSLDTLDMRTTDAGSCDTDLIIVKRLLLSRWFTTPRFNKETS